MKLPLLSALALLPLCTGCIISIGGGGWDSNGHWEGSTYVAQDSRPALVGSGVEGRSERTVEAFQRIDVQGPMDVTVVVGEATSVVVRGDDNVVERVFTRVQDGTLAVGIDNGRYEFRRGLQIVVHTPSLAALTSRGSGDVALEGLTGESFDLELRGSGDATLAGDVQRVRLSLVGSGDVDAAQLAARDADVSIDGSGDIVLCASETLDARISGSGDVRYIGRPASTLSITGSGSIRAR